MKRTQKFFICRHCHNLVGLIDNAGVPMICCGEPMTELVPNSSDGAAEKHLPVVTVEGCIVKVKVGSTAHPMEEAHSIKWIYVETTRGGQRVSLQPGEAPEAIFSVLNDKPVAVYAYCDLHGLYKVDVNV